MAMSYSKIKKLDEDSLRQMTEGKGPSDKCICNLLYAPEEKKTFRNSIKKAFASLGGLKSRSGKKNSWEGELPLNFSKRNKGMNSTKEIVKRNSACGKCGCDNENIVLKHSFATIKIVTPDISSICPCPEDCLPSKDKEKLRNNIQVTVEHVKTISDDESDLSGFVDARRTASEPKMARKTSLLSVDDEKYDDYDYESDREDSDEEASKKNGK